MLVFSADRYIINQWRVDSTDYK